MMRYKFHHSWDRFLGLPAGSDFAIFINASDEFQKMMYGTVFKSFMSLFSFHEVQVSLVELYVSTGCKVWL